jgi:hypothetical protein
MPNIFKFIFLPSYRDDCQCYHIECQIANLFHLTSQERNKLQQIWQPKIRQRIVHIDERNAQAMKYIYKNQFDSEGRFLYKCFPKYIFDRTTIVHRFDSDNNILISDWSNKEHEIIWEYPKSECYPILNGWQLFLMKRKLRKAI